MSTAANLLPTPIDGNNRMPLVLLVDDARLTRAVLQETLKNQGYQILMAESGEEALRILAEYPAEIDAMVLDREMPGMNGMEVVRRMKAVPQFSSIPIIMFTGTDAPDKIQEGIEAGVYYYLIKPADGTLLKSLIDSALRERQQKKNLVHELERYGAGLRIMQSCRILAHTIAEAESVACLIASCFPEPSRVVAGLMDLIVNCVEHGHVAISAEEKNQLVRDNRWREEIDRRALLPENAAKEVEIVYQQKDNQCLVRITDQGPGFDWKRYWHVSPARATSDHGRGIARARLMAFDRMSYNEQGNSVTVMVTAEGEPQDYAW